MVPGFQGSSMVLRHKNYPHLTPEEFLEKTPSLGAPIDDLNQVLKKTSTEKMFGVSTRAYENPVSPVQTNQDFPRWFKVWSFPVGPQWS